MIDDKPAYVSGSDLSNLFNSMSSTQVDQIELITNPSAKYDASGNAGIINIKTKKNKQVGFNGTLSLALGQGVYNKTNNSLVLNYRKGKFNSFFNYSINQNNGFFSIFVLRVYFNTNGIVTNKLEQFSYLANGNLNNTIKTGVDNFVNKKIRLASLLRVH